MCIAVDKAVKKIVVLVCRHRRMCRT